MAKTILILILITALTTSCLTTRTPTASYISSQEKSYVYAKGKQVWIFWGLIPMGRTNVSTPANGKFETITKFNFGDLIIQLFTAKFVITETIKVKAKPDSTQP